MLHKNYDRKGVSLSEGAIKLIFFKKSMNCIDVGDFGLKKIEITYSKLFNLRSYKFLSPTLKGGNLIFL